MATINAKGLIALAIGVAVLVGVIPQAIEDWSATNTTNWSTSSQSLWDLGPMIMIAVIIMGIAGGIVAKKKGMFAWITIAGCIGGMGFSVADIFETGFDVESVNLGQGLATFVVAPAVTS